MKLGYIVKYGTQNMKRRYLYPISHKSARLTALLEVDYGPHKSAQVYAVVLVKVGKPVRRKK
jgi:hypothetical protein